MKTRKSKLSEIEEHLGLVQIKHPTFPRHLNGVSPLVISASKRRKKPVTGENGPTHGMILVCGNVYTVVTTSYWRHARVSSKHPLLQIRDYHPEDGPVNIEHKRGVTPDQFEDLTGVKIQFGKD